MNTVLHMIESGEVGGAETVFLNIVCNLDPTRWRSIAVVPDKGWLYGQLVAAGVDPLVIPEAGSFDLGYLARLYALVRRENVTLIQAHLLGSAVRAGLLSILCKVPAIGTLHGEVDLSPSERFQLVKTGILNNGLQKLIFVSERLRRFFLNSLRLRPERTAVIPNGIEMNRFLLNGPRGMRAELGISEDAFLIGSVGNPIRTNGVDGKGFDILLRAAALLKARSVDCRFVIVGDLSDGRGDELVQLRSALGLSQDVVLTGFRTDVQNVLAALDLYVLSSRSEGFSLAVVEAMAAGLPVVATKCGGPEEIVRDGVTGVLVESESADAIAVAIARLRANPEDRRKLGVAARESVRERFTLEAQIKSYDELYENCLVAHRRQKGDLVTRR